MNTQTTYSSEVVGAQVPARGVVGAIKGAMRRLMKSLMAYHLERETARELSSLPSYILRDIGMAREDIGRVAADLAKERSEAWARQAEASNGFGG